MTTVYLLRDADGGALYAGATVGLDVRLRQHQHQRDWWPEVASTETWEYADHDEALIAEADLIHEARPRHNVRHNTGHRHVGRADVRRVLAQRAADPRTDDEILREAFARNGGMFAGLFARVASHSP